MDINDGNLPSLWEKHDKSVLTEFLMGYSDYGYCNGNTSINQKRIIVESLFEPLTKYVRSRIIISQSLHSIK